MLASVRSAFSLIELSIVIAIIGLLVGGVLAGTSLIDNAKKSRVGMEITEYSSAIQRFKERYGSLPGDMPDATNYWNAAHGTPATCRTTVTNDDRTCNGDGNGEVADSAGSNEPYRAWQQLAASGGVEGQYSGVHGSSSTDSNPGENVPSGPLSLSGYSLRHAPYSASSATEWDHDAGLFITFGSAASTGLTDDAILEPQAQESIDEKFDDGMPQSGFLISRKNSANCATTTSMSTARYNVIFDSEACILELVTERNWK